MKNLPTKCKPSKKNIIFEFRQGSLDGKIIPLEEKMQGENAPPMHPRCRCTITAVLGDYGKRSAKVKGKREKVPLSMSYAEWKEKYLNAEKRNGDYSSDSSNAPQWAARDRTKILTKAEYGELRRLADTHKIYLSGVKNFDGQAETIKEVIATLAKLQSKFPFVAEGGKRLTLTLNNSMEAADFAVTTKIRNINLNANAYRDVKLLDAEYQKAVLEGWFVKGTDYRAIIPHEFGHIVANVCKIDSLKIACEITGLSPKETLKFLKENLSEYAASYLDGKEIISEVFADMTTKNPNEFSRKFYEKVLEN